MSDRPDIRRLRDKIGLERTFDDVLTLRTAQAFLATFDGDANALRDGDPAPAGVHACLHTALQVPTRELQADGSDDDGGEFVSPPELPRRMRAGGGLRFHRPLRIGAPVQRRDRITGVELKQGRSGWLCFVTTQRDYHCEGALAMSERIDAVYRGPADPTEKPAAARPSGVAASAAATSIPLVLTPAHLLRYSAITFNAHRIHFDERYAIEAEGYPGLVVHGPLQATLLLRRAIALADGETLYSLEYRSTKPLILGDAARIASLREGKRIELAIVGADGLPTMSATAQLRGASA
ncbi:FAS1-like dehydratase domain-containing protein [Ramlibacter sp.]|uniref:FAS1-like dehydratase domain-containing protein n=1 Tax=Ramlibacter sp. TaxID=1917967 RepID=UPI003D0C3C14